MTYRNLIETMQAISANVGNQETKVQKKLVKIHGKLKEAYDVYADLLADLKLDAASVDDKGNVIMNEKGEYSYSKEGMKKLNADIKQLLDKEVEFKNIEVVNPEGLEIHTYLNGWVNGVSFETSENADIL